jgi:hypothetical protein
MTGHANDSLRILDPTERAKVQGHGRLDRKGDFSATIWNGAVWSAESFTA